MQNVPPCPALALQNVQVLHAVVAAPVVVLLQRQGEGLGASLLPSPLSFGRNPAAIPCRGLVLRAFWGVRGGKSHPWQDPVPAALSQVADVGSLGDTPAPAAVQLRAVSALLFKLNSCLLWLQDFPSPSAKPQKTEINRLVLLQAFFQEAGDVFRLFPWSWVGMVAPAPA